MRTYKSSICNSWPEGAVGGEYKSFARTRTAKPPAPSGFDLYSPPICKAHVSFLGKASTNFVPFGGFVRRVLQIEALPSPKGGLGQLVATTNLRPKGQVALPPRFVTHIVQIFCFTEGVRTRKRFVFGEGKYYQFICLIPLLIKKNFKRDFAQQKHCKSFQVFHAVQHALCLT